MLSAVRSVIFVYLIAILTPIAVSCAGDVGASNMIKWQWPAGREATKKTIIEVMSIKEYKGGLFGIGKSASVGDIPPDPLTLTGMDILQVLDNPEFAAIFPSLEIHGIEVGMYIGVGLSKSGNVICVSRAPDLDLNKVTAWLEDWRCE